MLPCSALLVCLRRQSVFFSYKYIFRVVYILLQRNYYVLITRRESFLNRNKRRSRPDQAGGCGEKGNLEYNFNLLNFIKTCSPLALSSLRSSLLLCTSPFFQFTMFSSVTQNPRAHSYTLTCWPAGRRSISFSTHL